MFEYFLALIILICIDFIYLHINSEMYKPIIQGEINKFYALLTWICIIIGIHFLVISRNDIDESKALFYGFILGFVSYSIYNFTNAAIYTKTHGIKIIIIDTIWGSLLTSFISYILYKLLSFSRT